MNGHILKQKEAPQCCARSLSPFSRPVPSARQPLLRLRPPHGGSAFVGMAPVSLSAVPSSSARSIAAAGATGTPIAACKAARGRTLRPGLFPRGASAPARSPTLPVFGGAIAYGRSLHLSPRGRGRPRSGRVRGGSARSAVRACGTRPHPDPLTLTREREKKRRAICDSPAATREARRRESAGRRLASRGRRSVWRVA